MFEVRLCLKRDSDVLYDGPPRPSSLKQPAFSTASEGHRTGFQTKPRSPGTTAERPPEQRAMGANAQRPHCSNPARQHPAEELGHSVPPTAGATRWQTCLANQKKPDRLAGLLLISGSRCCRYAACFRLRRRAATIRPTTPSVHKMVSVVGSGIAVLGAFKRISSKQKFFPLGITIRNSSTAPA